MRTLILLITVLSLAFSCVHTDMQHVRDVDNILTVAPKIPGSESALPAKNVKENPEYTVTHKTFTGDHNIGLFATTRTDNDVRIQVGETDDENLHNNSTVKMKSDGTVISISPDAYYATRDMKTDICAYYPRVEGTKPHAIEIKLPPVQTARSIPLDDIMYANGIADPRNNVAVPLEFKHAMALVQFIVKIPTTIKDVNGVESSIDIDKLINPQVFPFKASGTLSLADNSTTTTGDPVVTTPRLIGDKIESDLKWVAYEMLVIPQTVAKGVNLFQVQVTYTDGTTDTFKSILSNDVKLEGSKIHKFWLTANSNGILNVNPTIAPWNSDNIAIEGNTIPAEVDNTFNVTLINASTLYSLANDRNDVKFAQMSITEPGLESKIYELTFTPETATTDVMRDIDKFEFSFTKEKPASYPYTITKVDILNASKETVMLNLCYTDFPINSKKLKHVTLHQHTNSVDTDASITTWTTSTPIVSNPDAPIDNTMYISLFNTQATADNACNSVNKVKLEFSYNDDGIKKVTAESAVNMDSPNSNAQYAAATQTAIKINNTTMPSIPSTYSNLKITKVTLFKGTTVIAETTFTTENEIPLQNRSAVNLNIVIKQ